MENSKRLRTYAAEMPVELTDLELLDLGQRLAHRKGELEQLKLQKAEAAAVINAEIKAAELVITSTAKSIRDKIEMRSVDVEVTAHFATNTTRHVRTDTGEVVKIDALKTEDRQSMLFEPTDTLGGEPIEGEEDDDAELEH